MKIKTLKSYIKSVFTFFLKQLKNKLLLNRNKYNQIKKINDQHVIIPLYLHKIKKRYSKKFFTILLLNIFFFFFLITYCKKYHILFIIIQSNIIYLLNIKFFFFFF